jgi:Ca2+-binding EF-hand superfamily protein
MAFGGKTVTRTDFSTVSTGWFRKFDTDKDGTLTRKELGDGFLAALPPPDFGGFGDAPGGPRF